MSKPKDEREESNVETLPRGRGVADVGPAASPFGQSLVRQGPGNPDEPFGARMAPQPGAQSQRIPAQPGADAAAGVGVWSPEAEYIAQFTRLVDKVDQIYDAITGRGRPAAFVRPIVNGPLRAKLRLRRLILCNVAAAAGNGIFTVTTTDYPFRLPPNSTTVIPLDIVLDTGADILLHGIDGIFGYMVADQLAEAGG